MTIPHCLARALAADPVLLLMDEPFSAVDPIARSRLQEEFLRLRERAREAFERALVQNGDDARALDGMATLCLSQGNYEAAADWALSAVEKDMQYARGHYHLGMALSQINRPTEALAAFEASSRTDPTRAAPYYWMSRIAQQQLHDRERAEKYLAQGRQLLRQRRERRAAESARPVPETN